MGGISRGVEKNECPRSFFMYNSQRCSFKSISDRHWLGFKTAKLGRELAKVSARLHGAAAVVLNGQQPTVSRISKKWEGCQPRKILTMKLLKFKRAG